MSTLNVSNITDGTDTVETGYVLNGSAKAWVNLNGTGTASITGSFNVASITDNGTGNYSVTLTNAMDNNSGSVTSGSCSSSNLGDLVTGFGYSTSVFKLNGQYVHGSPTSDPRDVNPSNGAIHGDLA